MLSGRVSAQPAQSVIDIIYISPGVQISAPLGKAKPLALSLQVTVGLILDNGRLITTGDRGPHP